MHPCKCAFSNHHSISQFSPFFPICLHVWLDCRFSTFLHWFESPRTSAKLFATKFTVFDQTPLETTEWVGREAKKAWPEDNKQETSQWNEQKIVLTGRGLWRSPNHWNIAEKSQIHTVKVVLPSLLSIKISMQIIVHLIAFTTWTWHFVWWICCWECPCSLCTHSFCIGIPFGSHSFWVHMSFVPMFISNSLSILHAHWFCAHVHFTVAFILHPHAILCLHSFDIRHLTHPIPMTCHQLF